MKRERIEMPRMLEMPGPEFRRRAGIDQNHLVAPGIALKPGGIDQKWVVHSAHPAKYSYFSPVTGKISRQIAGSSTRRAKASPSVTSWFQESKCSKRRGDRRSAHPAVS